MKKIVAILGLGLLLSVSAQAKLKVVASLPDLGALAKEIGGDEVEVTTLALPTEDPHFVDAKPSFIVKLNRADALIEGGAELEMGWLPALRDRTRNTKLAAGAPGDIRANEGMQLLEVPGTMDRSHGDVHAAGNPHYLTDPANGEIVARHLAEAFSRLEPKSSGKFQENYKTFSARLTAKLAVWEKLLAPYKGEHLAAYHDSWPYFARRFGFNIDLFLEPKPGIPPTPLHLAEVESKMKQEKVKVIFVEPYLNRRTAEAVARKTGAVVLDVSQFPGGLKGTDGGYIQLMDYLVTSLSGVLVEQSKAAK
jgi:zinc/manganese transport system substrate-binding protein